MPNEPTSIPLTDEQRGQVIGILSVGCDRQSAVDYVGCSLLELGQAMERDAKFAAAVRRAEAGIELSHMRVVQEAAKDEKEWRAAVWWLERRSPERFGRRAGAVTARQLKAYIGVLVDIFREEVSDADDRQRVVARMGRVVDSLERMLCIADPNTFEVGGEADEAPTDDANGAESKNDDT